MTRAAEAADNTDTDAKLLAAVDQIVAAVRSLHAWEAKVIALRCALTILRIKPEAL
jgi:hypothetical protein